MLRGFDINKHHQESQTIYLEKGSPESGQHVLSHQHQAKSFCSKINSGHQDWSEMWAWQHVGGKPYQRERGEKTVQWVQQLWTQQPNAESNNQTPGDIGCKEEALWTWSSFAACIILRSQCNFPSYGKMIISSSSVWDHLQNGKGCPCFIGTLARWVLVIPLLTGLRAPFAFPLYLARGATFSMHPST